MAHSTTATSTYPLTKYSRSYPSASGSEQEWQHYTNPIIMLALDVKKLGQGELGSVRLRISWTLSGGDTMDLDQRVVYFEDLDLLGYSSTQLHPSHGPPLKAVYRESVVGIKYLHPRLNPPGQPPLFRRFQVTFESQTAAIQFTNSIRNVCPCKANPPSAPALRKSLTTTHGTTFAPSRNANNRITTQASLLARNQSMAVFSQASPIPSLSQRRPPSTISSKTPMTVPSTAPSSSPVPRSSDFDFNLPSSSSSSSDTYATACSSFIPQPPQAHYESGPSDLWTIERSGGPSPMSDMQPGSYTLSQPASLLESSLPPSSLESNSSRSMMPPPPAPVNLRCRESSPSQEVVSAIPSPVVSDRASLVQPTTELLQEADIALTTFLGTLNTVPDLYNLPLSALEELVAQVVHEEHFTELVEKISMIMVPNSRKTG